MALPDERLSGIIKSLARRPGHEPVHSDIRELLINPLGGPANEITLEGSLTEVRGRVDALGARTRFEFKSDLRDESATRAARLGAVFDPDFGTLWRKKAWRLAIKIQVSIGQNLTVGKATLSGPSICITIGS
ncbi:MAG TPA: hypothetical protein VKS22_06970 [Candidatus Binataceae bacterium]|nr:hypothetical protein [Candidatus Binataceae bacterium]